jgi:hypothetical protein
LKNAKGRYYLYALDQQGKAHQLGVVNLDNGNGKLDTTTQLDTFSIFLSADRVLRTSSSVLMRATLPSGVKEEMLQQPRK